MTKEEIRTSIASIKEVMERKVEVASPTCVIEKINDLSNLLGLSSELTAQTSKQYNEKIGVMMPKVKGESASDKRLILTSLLADEIYLMDLAAAINKDAHYCLESLRSMISYLKVELQNIK